MSTLHLAIRSSSVIYIVAQDNAAALEWQVMKLSSRNLCRKAIADFFSTVEPQHAHWYCIKSPAVGDTFHHELKAMFPPLSSLLNLPEDVLMSALRVAGVMYQRGNSISPLFSGWESFIAEFKLSNELTTFQVGGKPRLLIQVGSWSGRYPAETPKVIWGNRRIYELPRLRIATATMAFASSIGNVDLPAVIPPSDCCDIESEMSSSSSSDESNDKSESSLMKEKCLPAPTAFIEPTDSLLPETDFPFLHSLGIHRESQLNTIIQEIVKYRGSAIDFVQKNNRPGFLLLCPSSRSTDRYEIEFSKKGGTIDSLLSAISRSANCTEREASECILKSLYKKQDEAFTSVALEKGLLVDTKKKMDAVQVEAMLSEAGLCTNNARILFRHLNRFFGKGKFESEHKRRAFFAGSDYPPIVDKLILPDKTVINYWYKEPHKMLQQQISQIIKTEELIGLRHVDISVGGDHGGGKFRMTLKVLFRFHDKPTISRLFQIASVSHSKDDTDILVATVLKPVGESLRIITDGGHFVLVESSHSLSLTFSNVSTNLLMPFCFNHGC